MKLMKSKLLQTITTFVLIVAMTVGLAVVMEKRANAESITITYNLSDGQVSPSDSTKVVKKTYSTTRITLEKSSYYFPGKSIIGWATSSGGRKEYDSGQRVTISSNITLYAVWGTGTAACTHNKYTQQIIVQTRCDRDGKAKCTCSSCGKTWEKTLTAPGHKYGSSIIEKATCEKNGAQYRICSVCGNKKTEIISFATGHIGEVIQTLDDEKHLIECNKCRKNVEQEHEWTLKNSTYDGQHWYECSADGCNAHKEGSHVRCYSAVTNWTYFVDTKSYKGENLHVREGDCPVCGIHIIEYGLSSLKDTPNKLDNAINTLVSAAKFGLSFFSGGKKEVVKAGVKVIKGIFKIHTAYKIAKGFSTQESIKAKCEKNEAIGKKLEQCDLAFLKNLELVTKGSQAYEISVNLFKSKERNGIIDIYQ